MTPTPPQGRGPRRQKPHTHVAQRRERQLLEGRQVHHVLAHAAAPASRRRLRPGGGDGEARSAAPRWLRGSRCPPEPLDKPPVKPPAQGAGARLSWTCALPCAQGARLAVRAVAPRPSLKSGPRSRAASHRDELIAQRGTWCVTREALLLSARGGVSLRFLSLRNPGAQGPSGQKSPRGSTLHRGTKPRSETSVPNSG